MALEVWHGWLYSLRGMDDTELDRLIARLELRAKCLAAMRGQFTDRLLNALTAARLERDRRGED